MEASESKPTQPTVSSEQKFSKKFLFVSWESLSGDLAWQVRKEGNDVKVYIEDADEKDVYDGFLDKVDDWKAHKDWADVVVFDDTGFGKIADAFRKEGKLVVGGSAFPQNSANNPTGTLGALACWVADSIKDRYLKQPRALV